MFLADMALTGGVRPPSAILPGCLGACQMPDGGLVESGARLWHEFCIDFMVCPSPSKPSRFEIKTRK